MNIFKDTMSGMVPKFQRKRIWHRIIMEASDF